MDKYKKKFASALDGLRNHHTKVDIEVAEKIGPNNIGLSKIIRHGFPDKARCLAYDPVQKLIAIGSGNGSIRLLGDAGVDYHLRHPSGSEVTHIKFLINEGGLITVTKDDMIHLWNYRQKQADIVHSLQMRQEKITCIELPVSSKWLYIGTERGNVYVLCVANFKLSSYTINWNKAIDLSCRKHPGCVKHLSISPLDPTKLLIGFDNGYVVLWNLLNKEVERYKNNGQIKNISWHYDGKQFMCGCNDGSLVIWNVKKTNEPYQIIYPREQKCRPITHLFWFQGSSSDMVIFAGGMGMDDGATPAITVMKPKGSLAVLELDHTIIDVCPIINSPYTNFPQLPHALAILMKEELIILDLSVGGFPIFENPHPTDISESPVVYMKYYSDCPVDMIGALTLLGCKQRTTNPRISTKTWPITGGEEREVVTSNQELLLTGHEDGSIKFWQSSGDHLQLMYKLKTGRHFEKTEQPISTNQLPDNLKNPHSITFISMCLESRLLAVAGNAGQVTLFKLNKNESANDIAVINILGSCSVDSPFNQSSANVGDCGGIKNQNSTICSRTSSMTSEGSQTSEQHFLKVRGGAIRRAAGFQPELVCLITSSAHSLVNSKKLIGSISLNSSFGLMAIGTVNDLCLIDIIQCTLIFCLSISELYSFENISNTQFNLNVDSPQDSIQQNDTSPINKEKSGIKFMRLNTDLRQKSYDKRPILARAQSMAAGAVASLTGNNSDFNFGENGNNKDSSFSNLTNQDSPSISSSLEKLSLYETITFVEFISTAVTKNSTKTIPTLYVGTSSGICLAYSLNIPAERITTNVTFAHVICAQKLKGEMLYCCFMDDTFRLLAPPSESYKESTSDSPKTTQNKIVTKIQLLPTVSSSSSSSNDNNNGMDEINQVTVIVSESEARVIALPGGLTLFSYKSDRSFVKAEASHVSGHPVLIILNEAGELVVLSLPSLKFLFKSQLFSKSVDLDDPMVTKIDFSDYGLGVYMVTPSELQKFTISRELASQISECSGEVFVPKDMPDQPKPSLLQGVSTLFGGGLSKDINTLEAIFNDKDKNGQGLVTMKSIARTVQSSGMTNMEHAQSRGITAGQAAQMALQNLNERTDKLNAVVDTTENLKNNAQTLASRSGKLVEKYEKKKWYNF